MSIVYPEHRDYYDELIQDPTALNQFLTGNGPIITIDALEDLEARARAYGQSQWILDELSSILAIRYLQRGEMENVFASWRKVRCLSVRRDVELEICKWLETIPLSKYVDVVCQLEWERWTLAVSLVPRQKQFEIMCAALALLVLAFACSNLVRLF